MAERYPALVRRDRGLRARDRLARLRARADLRRQPRGVSRRSARAKRAIEDAAGVRVCGYRAPSYSITARSLWALDILIEEGYQYDASIFPIHHDRYGIAASPRHAYRIWRQHGSLWELPGSTVRLGGVNLPVAGGGYFRLLPYAWTKWGIDRVNRREGQPVVFYLHPWEIDQRPAAYRAAEADARASLRQSRADRSAARAAARRLQVRRNFRGQSDRAARGRVGRIVFRSTEHWMAFDKRESRPVGAAMGRVRQQSPRGKLLPPGVLGDGLQQGVRPRYALSGGGKRRPDCRYPAARRLQEPLSAPVQRLAALCELRRRRRGHARGRARAGRRGD